ncbi:MAG: extensin family protein, partial [Paracoccus sp. (in: a-proteobacteria)]|nr:extensin family protein [Paracoccus sp. (in: a-proteobacteria)]
PAGPPEWETLRESDADFTACTQALWRLGAGFTVEAPVTEAGNRDCGIARPVRVQTILPKVEIPGGAVMRCDTALALGRWLRDTVRPAGRLMPDRPELRAVLPGSTYQCRDRVGTAQTKMSEHALGNAFDVAGFRFEITRDGAPEVLDLPVTPRQDSGDMAEAFQRAVRGAACLYFTTVLGPGSNAAHDDHLHLDIRARNGGFRLCQ